MKKGSILAQPFVMIMALVVMGLVILFGIRAVLQIKSTADTTELVKFAINLENQVELMYNYNAGSVKDLSLNMPAVIEKICFSNPGEPVTSRVDDGFFKRILEADKTNNVFIHPLRNFKKFDYKIDNLRVKSDENPLCIETNGRLNGVMETIVYDNKIFVEIRRT